MGDLVMKSTNMLDFTGMITEDIGSLGIYPELQSVS